MSVWGLLVLVDSTIGQGCYAAKAWPLATTQNTAMSPDLGIQDTPLDSTPLFLHCCSTAFKIMQAAYTVA